MYTIIYAYFVSFGMVLYGMVWYCMVWYCMVWCGVVWCGVVWCGVVWCGVVWYGMDILFHLGKPLAMRLLHKTHRTVQTQAVNKEGCGGGGGGRIDKYEE